MFGLADCNNFFVSCEVAFNPSLRGKAVVVLSNNDGCVISRSYEAKALGIPMGCPAFKIKEYTDSSKVVMLSGQHRLYNDLSARVMTILGSNVEGLEIYSVDEAFFQMPYSDKTKNEQFAEALAEQIYKSVGIPVSFGIAETRTLAKIASHEAKKKMTITKNVFQIDENNIISVLKRTDIKDVWGIGRQTASKLRGIRINTAYEFTLLSSAYIKQQFSITGIRTQQELQGLDSISANPITLAHQSITTSRSFGTPISSFTELSDAITTFASNCAQRLREQNSVAKSVSIYIRSNIFDENNDFYSNSCEYKLQFPTNNSIDIVNCAISALRHIYRQGILYKKAGVILKDITSCNELQLNLFSQKNENKFNSLMKVIDKLNNKYGTQQVSLVPEKITHTWEPSHKYVNNTNQSLHIYSGMIRKNASKKDINE